MAPALLFLICQFLLCTFTHAIDDAATHAYSSADMDFLTFNFWFKNQRPVIVHSETDHWFANKDFFDIRNLFIKFGLDSFQCGTSTHLASMQRSPEEITLKLYLRKSKYKHYLVFDPFFIAHNADAMGIQTPRLLHNLRERPAGYTFLLGKVGSGMSFQAHGSAWWHQIKGKTRVFLYPPQYTPVGGALDWTSYTAKQWSKYILPYMTRPITNIGAPDPKEIWDTHHTHLYETNITTIADIFNATKQPWFSMYRPFECVLDEGDLLYIPQLWWYSTLNVKNPQNMSMAMLMQADELPKEAALARRAYNDPLRSFATGYEYLYRNSDVVNAKQYFTKALLVDPTFIQAYVALSDIFAQSAQKNQEHVAVLQRFLMIAYSLNPEWDMTRDSLIRIFTKELDSEVLRKLENREPLI